MKQMGIMGCLLIIVNLFFLNVTTPTHAEPNGANVNGKIVSTVEKVQYMNKVLHKHSLNLSSWSIFIREQPKEIRDVALFKQRAQDMKEQLSSFQWSKISKAHGFYSFSGQMKDPVHHTESHITLFAYPHKDAYESYLIYEISGSEWDNNSAVDIKRQINAHLSYISRQNMTFYTCLEAHDGATMNLSLSKTVQGLLHDLKARPVEKVSEKTFISVSAYTDYWKDSLKTGNKLMNVQVAIRKTGSATTIVMGTPIITIAY